MWRGYSAQHAPSSTRLPSPLRPHLLHTSAYVSIRQHSIRQHASSLPPPSTPPAYVSIRQHTSAYVSIAYVSMHASSFPLPSTPPAYVSIRQHTSAYVSIAYVSMRLPSPFRPHLRQHPQLALVQCASAYVSIRLRIHTSVSIRS